MDWDPPQYERIGTVDGKYTVQRKPVFAVVEVGATQFKVSPDDLVYAEKLKGVAVNDTLALMRVLMLGTTAETVIGRPFIPDARVTAAVEVRCLVLLCCTGSGRGLLHAARGCACLSVGRMGMQEQTLDAKVIIFHKRRRKNSRKTKGHRQASRTLLKHWPMQCMEMRCHSGLPKLTKRSCIALCRVGVMFHHQHGFSMRAGCQH